MENEADELWLQTSMSMPDEQTLYHKLGFSEQEAPAVMELMENATKTMWLEL